MSSRPAPSSPVSFQMLVGAAERLRRKRPQDGSEDDWLARAEDARDRLSRSPFVPEPLDSWIDARGGRERVVSAARPADRLVEEALLPRFRRALEPRLPGAVHGYRRGRSTSTAALAAANALRRGHLEILLLDVSGFYESIDRRRLREQLLEVVSEPVAELVTSLMAAPLLLQGRLVERERGIPPGRALAPLLANLHLEPLDGAASPFDVTYVRYGDDLFVAGANPETVEACEAALVAAAGSLGLAFSEAKRRRFRFAGEPFPYLGHLLDGNGIYERVTGPRLAKLEGSASSPPLREGDGVAEAREDAAEGQRN